MIHEMLGKLIPIGGKQVRIQYLRAECGFGIAGGGNSPPKEMAYLVRLSDGSVVRALERSEQDYDAVLRAAKANA